MLCWQVFVAAFEEYQELVEGPGHPGVHFLPLRGRCVGLLRRMGDESPLA